MSRTDQQQRLFAEETPWEVDDARSVLAAGVVFAEGPDQVYTYSVPPRLEAALAAGRRVDAPLGRGDRRTTGYCVWMRTIDWTGPRLKPLAKVVDERTLATPELIELAQWLGEEYLCSWGKALESIIPAGVRGQAGVRELTFLEATEQGRSALAGKLPPKQRAVLEALAAAESPQQPATVAEKVGCTQGPITALRKKGLVRAVMRRVRGSDFTIAAEDRQTALELQPDQQAALDAISAALQAGRHEQFLLFGVTGSGKTEVYIRAIDEVVARGRQAIVMVPEISLTPQTRQRFRARFDRVAVLHSHMTDSERSWHWERIAAGEVDVVVGARSAVFAPTPALGLIVIDEEHEGSFKQEQTPRYHARAAAEFRTRAANAPLVLGSATPSLESWHAAQAGAVRLLEMPSRVMSRPLPAVRIVDLCQERVSRSPGAIGRPLFQAMRQTLADDGQVILLLNRRGFSTHIQCHACGEALQCPHCDIALTHHRDAELAICHYCDYREPLKSTCPNCDMPGLNYGGLGTQKLESEVRARIPEFPCLRMDADTMRAPGSHERALAAFRDGGYRILLGTQMIAKGLDFARVMLVGVINADTALHLPDFRAAERAFQLITQVAGRTGRGDHAGRVFVQTFLPDHPAIVAAARHDYRGFAAAETPHREQMGYPPTGRMIRVIVRSPSLDAAQAYAETWAGALAKRCAELEAAVRVLGPAPAPISRIRGRHRIHFQATSPESAALVDAARAVLRELKTPKQVECLVDVDPLDML